MNQNGSSLIELMISMVVMGIVITGTYEGLWAIGATNVASEKSFSAQQAVAEAAFVLENLPADSPYLKDDGDTTDQGNVTDPDHQKNPVTGASSWTMNINGKQIGIIYNISAGTVGANISAVRIFALWDETGTAALAGPRDHLHRAERLILRGGTQ